MCVDKKKSVFKSIVIANILVAHEIYARDIIFMWLVLRGV